MPRFMSRLPAGVRRAFRIDGPRALQGDIDEEVAFHLEMTMRDLMARGMTADQARAEALRRFGDPARWRRALRATHDRRAVRDRLARWFDALRQDVRYGGRALCRTPAFSIAVVLTLALGIAMNAAVFSIVETTLVRPLPYPNSDRLLAIASVEQRSGAYGFDVRASDYFAYRQRARSFSGALADYTSPFTLASREGAEYLQGAVVTTNAFHVLGVSPMLGRDFTPEEDVPGGDRVVIIGYHLWQRRFGADPGVLGRVVRLNGGVRTVIGVMPREFDFPETAELWVPAAFDQAALDPDRGYIVNVVARLRHGVRPEQADAEVSAIARELARRRPATAVSWTTHIRPFRDRIVGSNTVRTPLRLLVGAVAFVLLIACANAANMQLARTSTRRREIAVRVALGAGRERVVSQLLVESLLIAGAGGVLGTVGASWALRVVLAIIPSEQFPEWLRFHLDPAALTFAVAITLLTAIAFGLAPALQATRFDLQRALRVQGRGTAQGAGGRMRDALVVAQIALSLVLLVGAGLMTRSFLRIEGSALGFDPDHVLTAHVTLAGARYDSSANRGAFYTRLVDRLSALPDVQAVAAVNAVPMADVWTARVEIDGRSAPREDSTPTVSRTIVIGDYFRALRVPLLAGRAFSSSEWADTSRDVAIVSATMATRFWLGESPLGRRVRLAGPAPGPWLTVVGIAGDVQQRGLGSPLEPVLFTTGNLYGMTLVIRGAGDPSALAGTVRRTVTSVDPDVPTFEMASMRAVIANSMSSWFPRLFDILFSTFAAAALLLAAVGVHGVVAYSVAQRTQELGVRVALGATTRDLVRLVVGGGARLALIGVVIGGAAAFALTRLLASLLYEVSASDPMTFGIVPIVLVAVMLVASYLPARVVARLDPLRALRTE